MLFPGNPFPFTPRHGVIRPGIPSINWSNKITNGLLYCFLPGATQGMNIVNPSFNMSGSWATTAVGRTVTQDGPAFMDDGNASSSGFFGAVPVALSGNVTGSFFWRGQALGAPQTGAVYAGLLDVAGTAGGAVLLTNNGTDLVVSTDYSSGSIAVGDTGIVQPSSGMFDFGIAYRSPTSATSLYVNGKTLSTVGFSGADYTGTGIDFVVSNAGTNTAVNFVAMWDRPLTSIEMISLHWWPYQFLNFPDDMVYSTLYHATVAAASHNWFSLPFP